MKVALSDFPLYEIWASLDRVKAMPFNLHFGHLRFVFDIPVARVCVCVNYVTLCNHVIPCWNGGRRRGSTTI